MRKISIFCRLLFARRICLTVLLVALPALCFARPKKDVIQFANGDRITGEIIKLEKGSLYVKLDYADGTVVFDWSKIASIESEQGFVVMNKDGKRYTGRIESLTKEIPTKQLSVRVVNTSHSQTLAGTDTVRIDQTETRFLQNLHGGIDVGFTFSKQQDRAQYSLTSNTTYERTKWSADAYYDSSFSGGGDLASIRNDLRLDSMWQLRSPTNFYLGYAEFLHNGEQQLDLRTTFGAALGHTFRHTNNSLFSAYGGVVWNRERYSEAATNSRPGDSAEGVLGSQLNLFRFKTTNIFTDARVYPSLSDLGRTRFDLNTSFKLKLAKDLDWQLSYYLNVDSRPPQELPKTDYGTTSGLGWTF